MMLSTCARSPVTARARLARSLVVATTRMVPAAAVWAMNDKPRMKRTRVVRGLRRPRARRLQSDAPRRSPFRNEDALREHAVYVFLGVRHGADPAIHRDACEPIGIEARD